MTTQVSDVGDKGAGAAGPVIELDHVVKHYRSGGGVTDISLSITNSVCPIWTHRFALTN